MRRLLANLPVRRLLTPLAVLTLVMTSLGCYSRTVYVVDDDQSVRRAPPPRRAATPRAPVVDSRYNSNSDFYATLAPYGDWRRHRTYGDVWVPYARYAGQNFRPYTRGYWSDTEYGYTWNSSLAFGGVTSHYGRWFYDARLGWAWAPDNQWGPAWVTWRRGGGFVGWAPLPPGAYYGGNYTVYRTSWVFVNTGRFGQRDVYRYAISGPRYNDCYSNTRPVRNTVEVRGRRYYRGPDRDAVSRGGGRVDYRPIRDSDRGPRVSKDRSRGRAPVAGSRDRDRVDARAPVGRDPVVSGRDRDVRNPRTGDRDPVVSGRDRARDPVRADPVRGRGPAVDVTVNPRENDRRVDGRKPRDPVRERDARDRYDLGDRDVGVVNRDKNRASRDNNNFGRARLPERNRGHELAVPPKYEDSRSPDENPYARPPTRETRDRHGVNGGRPTPSPNNRGVSRSSSSSRSKSRVSTPSRSPTTTKSKSTSRSRSTSKSKSKSSSRSKSKSKSRKR